MNELIQKAIDFAKIAHVGQKYGGKDYFEAHLEPVAKIVENNFELLFSLKEYGIAYIYKEQAIACAYLHDVLEDTEYTLDGFPILVDHTVKVLTRNEFVNYFDYINLVNQDRNAYIVKIADLAFNIYNSKEGARKDKYRFALSKLARTSNIDMLINELLW